MTARAVAWMAPIGRWLATHPYTAVGLIVLAIVAVPFLKRDDSEWEKVYVQAARELLAGNDIYYQADIANSYPPFATLMAVPFTVLPSEVQRGLWLIINLSCLVFMLRGAWRLAGGGPLEGSERAPLREHVAAIVGGLCGAFYLQNALAHQQTDIVLGTLLIGGCLALGRDRSFTAATCFGLAAAVKCTPLFWAPYLVWRRRPGAAVWLAAVMVGVNLLPDLIQRPASGNLWLTEYVSRYLLPMGHADQYVGTWYSALVYNQSLSGAGQRWLGTDWIWTPDDCVVFNRPNRLAPWALNGIVYGVELGLILLTLAICRRPFRRLSTDQPGVLRRNALEYGAVFLLMVLLSPMSSKAHFGTLILPGFCLARAAFGGQRHWLGPLLAVAILLAVFTNKGLLGERLYTLSLWLGLVTWQTLLLLAGCLGLLVVRDNAASGAMFSPASDVRPRLAA
jgi:hypothetical protein